MTLEPRAGALDLRLVPAALTAWAVTAAAITWNAGWVLAAVCTAAAAACVPALWRGLLRRAGAGVLGLAVVGAGFGLSAGLRADAVAAHPLRAAAGATVEVTLTPVEGPRPVAAGRVMFRAALSEVNGAGTTGAVTVFAPAADYARSGAGRPVRFRARVSAPARHDLSVAVLVAVGRPVFGEAGWLQRGAQRIRDGFAAAARAALPTDEAAILPGLVLGDTAAVAPATTAAFRTAGLTHLTAVSGANVTIVCGTVLLVARLLGPRTAVALAALALIAFVIVVQPTPSVLRAAVMGALALLAVLTARRRQAVPALSATVIALMVLAPQLAVDVGFALSVSATAAIVLLAPVWSAGLVARGWPEPLAAALCVALAAQVVTAPLIAAVSGRFSVVSVAANLLVAPVIPPITVLGTAAAALCPVLPPAAGLLIRFTGPELWWLLRVAGGAAALPGAAVPAPSGWAGVAVVGIGGLAAVLLWRRRWFRWTAGAVLLTGVAWSVSGLVGGA